MATSQSMIASVPRSTRPEHHRRESIRRESVAPAEPRSRSPVSRKRVPVESIAEVVPTNQQQMGQDFIVQHAPTPPTAFNVRSNETQTQNTSRFHSPYRNQTQQRVDERASRAINQPPEEYQEIYVDVSRPPPSRNASARDLHMLPRAVTPPPELSYTHPHTFAPTPTNNTNGWNSSRDSLPSRSYRPEPLPRHARGEKRRATSPPPQDSRSVSPLPSSPLPGRSKALPENPSQTHLTTQAKKFIASDVRSRLSSW